MNQNLTPPGRNDRSKIVIDEIKKNVGLEGAIVALTKLKLTLTFNMFLGFLTIVMSVFAIYGGLTENVRAVTVAVVIFFLLIFNVVIGETLKKGYRAYLMLRSLDDLKKELKQKKQQELEEQIKD